MDESTVKQAIESDDPTALAEALRQLDVQIESASDGAQKANLLLEKATVHGILRQFENARKVLALVEQSAPDNTDVHLQRDFIDGSLFDQERNPEEAYLRLSSVMSRYSDRLAQPDLRFMYEDIQLRRGFDATSIGKFREALPILKECSSFALKPLERGMVLADLGRCYSEFGEYESSADCLDQAISLGLPTESEGQAHLYLAMAYARLNRFEEAKKEFHWCEERAMEYGLDVVKIYRWLAWVHEGLGNRLESEKYTRMSHPC